MDAHRRRLIAAAPAALAACSSGPGSHAAVAQQTWRHGPLQGLHGRALQMELVRYATLAASSHNTQCWRFALDASAIRILPDTARRCPAVDPDDHHLFVSLGCAAENLVQAAAAHGLAAQARFDADQDTVRVELTPAPPAATALFQAIPVRQSTRGLYDGQPLAPGELALLERAAHAERVQLLLLTGQSAIENVLAYVVQGNTAQLHDPAFMAELKAWIRFSGAEAVRQGMVCSPRRRATRPCRPGWAAWRSTCSSPPMPTTRATPGSCAARPAWRCSPARTTARPTGWKWAAPASVLRCRPRRWTSARPS